MKMTDLDVAGYNFLKERNSSDRKGKKVVNRYSNTEDDPIEVESESSRGAKRRYKNVFNYTVEVLDDKVKEWRDQYGGRFVAPCEIVRHNESSRDVDSFEFRFKGLTMSVNNQTLGEMEDISFKLQDEYTSVNENEMEDNNIDISVDLEANDNIDVNQVFQNEAIGGKMDEKSKEWKHIEDAPSYSLGLTQYGLILTGEEQQNTGQNVEAWNIDFDKVPEVPKTVYIQKQVEEINQQTDKGTRERDVDVDVVESRNTTVDASNEATSKSTSVTGCFPY
ncbi:hypothetical protein L1987_37976 [Smallanthus sonchifolius]|uniref:Uncharacterized protein n=1 Tax=Smallanthus sonchifolius TaxID=185202 RepID=A0ACB9HHD6_9ASTR|nr:hypothetical protein L1987_37976 [Smallanthus sonchifolius]